MPSLQGLIWLHTAPLDGEIITPILSRKNEKVCLECGEKLLGQRKFCTARCLVRHNNLSKKPLSAGAVKVALDEDRYAPYTHLESFPHWLKKDLEWAIYQHDINEESFVHDYQLSEYHDCMNDDYRERRLIKKISKLVSSSERDGAA